MKATTVKQIYQSFDPLHDLSSPEELTMLYVDRKSGIRQTVMLALDQDLEFQKPVHLLFSGQRGSGKSTEINKLCSELNDKFFIIKVQFRNRSEIDTVDVLLKAAMALFKSCTDESIIGPSITDKLEDLFSELYLFVHHQLFSDVPVSRNLDTALTAQAKINLLTDEFEARFEVEALSRTAFKLKIEKHLADLIGRINILATKVREETKHPVLFVFENADKFDLINAEEIFYKRGNTLLNICASTIYVVDIALRYNAGFAGAKTSFTHFFSLPNLNLLPFARDKAYVYENETDDYLLATRALLETLIDCRAENHIFEPGTKNLLIQSSGGLIRSLVALIQSAASKAYTENCTTISLSHVNDAIAKQLADFIAVLTKKHYPVLASLHEDKNLSSDNELQFLIHTTALLAFENGKPWCEINPILLAEVQKRVS